MPLTLTQLGGGNAIDDVRQIRDDQTLGVYEGCLDN